MRERSWQRWQDWAAVVIGVLTALSPIVTTTDAAAAWTMVVLGVLLFVAPWVMSYTDLRGAAWTSWVAGVLAVVVAAFAIPQASSAHSSHHPAAAH